MTKTEKLIKARCLYRFSYNSKAYVIDDIFTGSQADIDALKGSIDAHPDSVAYAESLKALNT